MFISDSLQRNAVTEGNTYSKRNLVRKMKNIESRRAWYLVRKSKYIIPSEEGMVCLEEENI